MEVVEAEFKGVSTVSKIEIISDLECSRDPAASSILEA